MNALKLEQGSPEWLAARLGVITASRIYDILPNQKTGKHKEARKTYMNELIGEVCTGYSEELNARALEWGKTNEEAAIAAYEFASGNAVEKLGLVYKDDSRRCGASPDFKLSGKNHGGENKCPITPKVHVDFILDGFIKPEYLAQIQFGLWCTGWDAWDFVSYHPRMKTKMVHYVTIEKDMATQWLFDEIVPQFILDMDKELAKIGMPWGSQWA